MANWKQIIGLHGARVVHFFESTVVLKVRITVKIGWFTAVKAFYFEEVSPKQVFFLVNKYIKIKVNSAKTGLPVSCLPVEVSKSAKREVCW